MGSQTDILAPNDILTTRPRRSAVVLHASPVSVKHDLVIRNDNVVDGTGRASEQADIAINGDTITAAGHVAETGQCEIDATGHLVAPDPGSSV